MAWKGASNIGSASDSDDGVGGMAIDLGRMNEVVLSEESKDGSRSRSVSIGPGARWGDVYKTLEKDGLSTSGARMDLVGVGGFLVGGESNRMIRLSFPYRSTKLNPWTGGISFYSPQRGFASHDVLNYELVLSNGTILDVNKLSHPSLFWALKMGSTNYGIVTRFDMITYPQGDVWAGVQIYPISDGPDLLDNLVTYTKNLHEDPKGFLASGIIWDSRSRKYAAWSAQTYLDPTPYPLLFHGLKSLSPYMDTMAISPLSDATTNMGKLFPSGGRTAWTMLSIRPDAKFIWDAHMKGKEIFDESILERDGVNWAVLGQPFLSEMFAAGKRSGGDPMNLKEEDGDLISTLYSLSISWWNVNTSANRYIDDLLLELTLRRFCNGRQNAGIIAMGGGYCACSRVASSVHLYELCRGESGRHGTFCGSRGHGKFAPHSRNI